MVSVLPTVAVLVNAPSVRVSLPPPRSMEALVRPLPSVMVSSAGAADECGGVLDGACVGDVGEGELVGAGAEIDGHGGCERYLAERDGVGTWSRR